MSLIQIVKAYCQSPRNWALLGAAVATYFQGNAMGLTDAQIMYIMNVIAGFFGVVNSIRPPRLPESNTNAA